MRRHQTEESPLCKPRERYGLAFMLAFLAACADIYGSLEMPWWHRVDADDSVQEVQARIRRIVREELQI